MKKVLSKESLLASSWLPRESHINMSKGFKLVAEYIGKPLYYCRLASSLSSKKDARHSLEHSFSLGSIALRSISLRAYPGGMDNSSDSLDIYTSCGHSFFVSIISGAKCDAEGYYSLTDLVVHDPGLLPLPQLHEGMGFYDYLRKVLPDSRNLFFSFEFFADPASPRPAPIPPHNFKFTPPKYGGSKIRLPVLT